MRAAAVSLGADEADRAGAMIARAFHNDPLTMHVFPGGSERARLTPAMFAAFVRYDRLFGRVDRLADFGAVASWQPPGAAAESPACLARAGFGDLPDGVPPERLGAVLAVVADAVGRLTRERHWHLRLLAVEPTRQRGGLGGALLRQGLERANAGGWPVVVETFAEPAASFYRRHGFEPLVEGLDPGSGLRYWALRHPAGPR